MNGYCKEEPNKGRFALNKDRDFVSFIVALLLIPIVSISASLLLSQTLSWVDACAIVPLSAGW